MLDGTILAGSHLLLVGLCLGLSLLLGLPKAAGPIHGSSEGIKLFLG